MKRKIYPLLFFAAVVVLAFWKVLFHPEFTLLTGGDMAAAYYPWFDVASYWLKKGIFLLWDPYVYAGKLNMGEPQPGLFYPLNWIFMLLPSRTMGISLDGLQALLILDYFLAAFFAYLLARSLGISVFGAALTGMTFSLGGFTIQLYGYVNVLSGFVWMPMALLCFHRALLSEMLRIRFRWLLGCGSALAFSFLAGHHIPPIHTGLLLLFYCIYVMASRWRETSLSRKAGTLAALGSIPAIAASLTAFQWLPSAEWARHVFRWVGGGEPVKWGQKVPYSVLQGSANLSPQDGVSLLLPYVSTSANIYVGGIILFLALTGLLFARNSKVLFFAAGAFLYYFLAWGQFSALHGWLNTFIPGVWFAREVFYYLVPFQICLALLAGWGLDRIVENYSGQADNMLVVFIRRAGWVMALIVLFSGALVAVLHFHRGEPMNHPYVTALTSLACYLGTLGFCLFLLHSGRLKIRAFTLLVIGLALFDLTSRLSNDIRTKELPQGQENTYVRKYWQVPRIADRLLELRRGEMFRVDDPSGVFPPNYGDMWRLEATMGHGATALVDYFMFRGTGWGPSSNATALLNAVYIPSREPIPGMKKIFEDGDAIYRNTRAVPRAFVASRYRAFPRREEILGWLPTPLFAPRETVLLEANEIERLTPECRRNLISENDGIRVRLLALRTAAEKRADTLTDEAVRYKLMLYKAPWGWSSGDEISLGLSPGAESRRCFAILTYFPTKPAASRLKLKLDGGGGQLEIPVELAGPGAGESEDERPRRQVVDLGNLGSKEHRLSLTLTEECPARIDHLRFVADPASINMTEAGSVRVTSFKPNLVRMEATMRRPSFIVLSEVNYPGWQARVDGIEAPLLTGDYILRAIPVPAGQHSVEVRFRSRSFFIGLAVSFAALAIFLICWILTCSAVTGSSFCANLIRSCRSGYRWISSFRFTTKRKP